MGTTSVSTIRRDSLVNDFGQLWRGFDAILSSLSTEDWNRKHGRAWTFADLPYHLAYFDRDVLANSIAKGSSLPVSERWLMQNMNEIDAWNAKEFAKRPAGQTAEQSLAQWRAGRDAVRIAMAQLSDADLARPAWSPFIGWMTVNDVLVTALAHSYSHYVEAKTRLKRSTSEQMTSQARKAMKFYVGLMSNMLNKEQAAGQEFSAVIDFGDVGAWTIKVADGTVQSTSGKVDPADLVMAQSPETFLGVMNKFQNPMLAMVTRKMRVKGMRNMGKFQKLFPEPSGDTLIFPRADIQSEPATIQSN